MEPFDQNYKEYLILKNLSRNSQVPILTLRRLKDRQLRAHLLTNGSPLSMVLHKTSNRGKKHLHLQGLFSYRNGGYGAIQEDFRMNITGQMKNTVAETFARMGYALRVRTTSPSAWNSFCRDVNKVDWMTSEQPSSSSSSAPLSVGGVAGNGYEKVLLGGSGCEDGGTHGWSKLDATQVGQQEAMPSAPEGPRRGLARAFDDEAFNEKAEKLLNPHQEEDIAAGREVISGPEPVPTRCSAFHKVIQEKKSLRYELGTRVGRDDR